VIVDQAVDQLHCSAHQSYQIYFFKKGQTFSKKGQKRPTKLLKKAKYSIKNGQKRAKPSI